jgi:RNA polymerase sigma-70 factor (ECF subfamily)
MAFADLIGGRLDAACRLAAVVLGESADAEDAVQDAAIRAWQHSDDLRDLRRFDAWFDRIVLNVCRDRLRVRRLRPTPQLGLAELGAADQTENLARADALTQAILTLTPEHRTVVALRYLADLSPEEIAARTGSRTGTVKSRLHYALRELRAAYDAEAR